MRIRKFNEEFDEETGDDLDIVWVKDCFADLVDSEFAEITEHESAAYGKWVSISVSMVDLSKGTLNSKSELVSDDNSFVKYVKIHNENNNRLNSIKNALEKLTDIDVGGYPNYKITVDVFSSVFIKIFA